MTASIQAHRDFYANYIVRKAGSKDERLVAAFSSVPREHYVGPGPWKVSTGPEYLLTVGDEPYLLYQDVLIGLSTERGINNGEPSLHARCLAAVAPVAGESVIHIGAGTGYYSAILAQLVAPGGNIVAYEIEADLAARAKANLKAMAGIEVVAASAVGVTLSSADVIYVNAGATHPVDTWLDALNIGGRLIFPLTPDKGLGCMLLIKRRGASEYDANVVARVGFIPCIGARDEAASKSLAMALERQPVTSVRSLRRDSQPDDSAWCVGNGWWISTEPTSPTV